MRVAKKKLIGFSAEALRELERRKTHSGKTQTRIINDLLLGGEKFSPRVEAAIAEKTQTQQITRHDAVNELLAEAIAIKELLRDALHSGRQRKSRRAKPNLTQAT